MSEATDLSRLMYDAVNRQDPQALLAVLHPDVTFAEPDSLPHGGVYTGHEGIVHFLAKLGHFYEADLGIEAERYVDAGDTAVVLGRFRARVRESGNQLDVAFAEMVRVEDGLIREIRVYPDTAPMVSALAGAGASA